MNRIIRLKKPRHYIPDFVFHSNLPRKIKTIKMVEDSKTTTTTTTTTTMNTTTTSTTTELPTMATLATHLCAMASKKDFFHDNMFFISCLTGGILVLISVIIFVCSWARYKYLFSIYIFRTVAINITRFFFFYTVFKKHET